MPDMIKTAIWYIGGCFVLSVVIVLLIAFNETGNKIGMLNGAWLLFLTTVFPAAGALIGNVLRNIAMPDAIFTGGGMSDILKAKFFWTFGPQLIGGAAGYWVAFSIFGPIK